MCRDFKGPKEEDESKDSKTNEFNKNSNNVKLIITQCVSAQVLIE